MGKRRARTRREFLKAGAAGIAGTALFPACSSPQRPVETPPAKHLPAIRTLGRTGLKVPVVSMGSVYAVELIRAALDQGIGYVHTSSGYSERNHERLLGRTFREFPRDSFLIGTSPDLPYKYVRGQSRSGDIGTDVDVSSIPESIDGSLQRLGLDHVDIYYLLSVGTREEVLHEPYMRAFESLKQEGKTRFIGVGTHRNEPEVIRAAAESGVWDVVLTAYNFRQTHREEVSAAIGQAAAAGLGVIAMKTQAGVYWDSLRVRQINMKAALKWVLQDENVHTTIPAFANFEEMLEDLSVMEDLTLTAEERRDLGLGDVLGLSGFYCQQCGSCLEQCPAGMEIPALMRGAMYAFGHEKPDRAKEVLSGWTAKDVACLDCTRCDVRCSLGIDVRARSVEMARFLETSRGHPA